MSKAFQFPDDPHQPNPFGDNLPPPDASDNPYASPQAPAYLPGKPGDYTANPHRGGVILAMGIVSLVVMLASLPLSFCCFPVGIFLAACNLGLSIPAWLMGRHDLQAISAGAIDLMGRGTTQFGNVLGIVSCVGNFISMLIGSGMLAVIWFAG